MEWRKNIYVRRIRLVLAGTVILWMLFLARFWYLQVISHEDLTAAADAQHQVTVEGLDSRGGIWDRNLMPLTGSTDQYFCFLPSSALTPPAKSLLQSVLASPMSASGGQYEVWRTAYFDEEVNRRLKEEFGAYVLCLPSRFSDEQAACHLIGYLNESEETGMSGLEKAFETQLQSDGRRILLRAGGSGLLIPSEAPAMEGGSALTRTGLVTSLEVNLQNFCENLMKERNLHGAVLVSHAETGEILAWVSAPSFNPNAVETYLKTDGDELVNKVIQGNYPPGSVFKVVLAAAALETGAVNPEEAYRCTGETVVGGVTLGCRAGPEGGHGRVNLEEAMALSCNCYFAHLGETLGWEVIAEMAENLGFGSTVMKIFTEESAGYLPPSETLSPADISSLSIGQGKILATPMQVHQMMSVVAAGGTGRPLTVLPAEETDGQRQVLSEDTAEALSDMLSAVMTEGTGAAAESGPEDAAPGEDDGWPCAVYGKTGTAEGWRSGQEVKQCWFSGFCGAGEGRYVITVLAEDGVSGSSDCLPVFREITEYLAAKRTAY